MSQTTADDTKNRIQEDQIQDLDAASQAMIDGFSSANDPEEGQLPRYVTVGPEKWLLLDTYRNGLFGKSFEMYYEFQVRSDDVFIMGLPRSGTSMIEELVWLLVNNLDYEKANETAFYRSPHLETDFKQIFRKRAKDTARLRMRFTSGIEQLEIKENRRTIQTHLPLCMLPGDVMKTKVVYVARNPKDLAVSLFNIQKNMILIAGIHKFDDFWYCFKNGLVLYGPYWTHIRQAWEVRDRPNVHFVFYENFVADLETGIKDVSSFLEKDLSEAEVETLVDYFKFDNFKKMIHKRRFFDSFTKYNEVFIEAYLMYGRPGAWREYFTAEMGKEADEWIKENVERIVIEDFPIS